MKEVFDLIEAINETAMRYRDETGVNARTVAISPSSYRRLLEISAEEGKIGNLIIGCSAIQKIDTLAGTLDVVIDELVPDTSVELA